MESRHVRRLRDELADKVGAANQRLKALKALFSWAAEAEEAKFNPARNVKLIKYKTKGHHSWTIEEVDESRGVSRSGRSLGSLWRSCFIQQAGVRTPCG